MRCVALAAAFIMAALTLYGVGAFSPAPALADHVAPGASCKEWANQHPESIPQPGSWGYDACTMTADMQAEFDQLIKNAQYCPEGVSCGLVVPAPGAAVRQVVSQAPRVRNALEVAGAGAKNALTNLYFSMMAPDGSVSGLRTQGTGSLMAGAGAAKWVDGNGNAKGQLLVTKMHSNGQIEFQLKTDSPSNYLGYIGSDVPNGETLSTKNPTGYSGGSLGVSTGCPTCKFQVWVADMSPTGEMLEKRVIGTLDAGTSQTLRPPTYNLSEVGAPEKTTANPPEGDTVMPPHETRILLDEIRALPEYNPSPPPQGEPTAPPDVDPAQWKQHQRRKNELAPPHGAPQGNPDYTINEDGSLTTRFADGTTLTTWPDLTELVKLRNGDELWKYPDGTIRENSPTTNIEEITYPDGTTVINKPGEAPVWSRPPSPGAEPVPIPVPPPGEYPSPPTANYPSPNTDARCNTAPYKFALPKLQLFEVFPFSLVYKAWTLMQSLVATPERPSFSLPGFGTVTVPDSMDAGIEMFRGAVAVVMLIGMCFMFYRTISGAGGGGSG